MSFIFKFIQTGLVAALEFGLIFNKILTLFIHDMVSTFIGGLNPLFSGFFGFPGAILEILAFLGQLFGVIYPIHREIPYESLPVTSCLSIAGGEIQKSLG